MVGKKLFFNILLRISLLIITSTAVILVVFRMQGRESIFTLIVGAILILVQIYMLTRFVLRVNRILTSFIESVGLSSATELHFRDADPLLSGLESRLNQLKSEISQSRFEEQKQRSLLEFVVGSMDTGLICVNQAGDVVFSNRAADSIWQYKPMPNLGSLGSVNPSLAGALESSRSGIPRIIELAQFKASVRCNSFVLDNQHYSLYSIQDIQREIDAQESESWQKLIRVLTHEIMNSMGPILSLSKSLKNSVDSPEKMITGLSTIENTGEGLIHFIKEYRRLSSLPVPEKSTFPVAELFDHIQALFSEEFLKNGIQCRFHIENPGVTLVADRGQVEQILINLVKNAQESLQASPRKVIVIGARQLAGMTEITVEDSGPGIAPEIKDQIFVPFYSTKLNGTGIGLSLARQIMNNHHGTIHFTSIPGEKTVFSLTF